MILKNIKFKEQDYLFLFWYENKLSINDDVVCILKIKIMNPLPKCSDSIYTPWTLCLIA